MALAGERGLIFPVEVFNSAEVMQSLKDSFFLIDRFGCFLYACPLLARMLGLGQGDMIGKNLSQLLPAGQVSHFMRLRDKLLSGQAVEFEWELLDEERNPSYLRISLNPWHTGNELAGAVGIAFDITEDVVSEQELEKKALLMRLQMDILESLKETGGITETLREIVDRACDALGMEAGCLASVYPSERGWLARQIIDNKWPMGGSVVAQWKELPDRPVQELFDRMEVFSLKEGEGPGEWLAPLESRLILVTPIASSPQGAFALITASSEDRQWQRFEKEFLQGLVSIGGQALQRAEMVGTLRQAEETYISLAESVNEAIAIIESEKIVFANHAMARLMGMADPNELKGCGLDDFLMPESMHEVRLRASRKELTAGKMNVRIRRPDGHELVTDVEITHLAYGHRKAYQVMIKGDGEPGGDGDNNFDFMSRLSHDFRTPLVSVTGFADILPKLVGDGQGDPKVEECVEGIKRGVKRLTRLVENMLALARAEAVSSDSWSSPGRVLRDVLEDLRQFTYETGVEVIVPSEMPQVRIGESELQEIFQNLLSNAVRAVRGVANPCIIVGYEARGSGHVFSIEDNGVGIPQKYHETVFKPLFRLSSGADGSGLGLSIVRKILRTHEGDIWVKSAPGFGTTFYFSLP